MYSYVHYYFSLVLISVYFSFSVVTINAEYALNNETDYGMNKYSGFDENAAPADSLTKERRFSCKEQSVNWGSYNPVYSLDEVSLNHHGTQKRNSTGHRTSFELYFAVKTEGYVEISLSEKEDYYSGGIRWTLTLGADGTTSTEFLYNRALLQEIDTPDIFSSTEFKAFYIKIDDGKLQFGKEDDTPLISYSDFDLDSVNYYTFNIARGSAKIRYCHTAVEVDCGKLPLLPHGSAELLNGTMYLGSMAEYSCTTDYQLVGPTWRTCTEDFQWSETAPICKLLPCKEQSVNWGGETPQYSMDNVSLNHYGKQTRNSTRHRTYFELHFALQTDGTVGIELTDKESSSIRYTIYLGYDRNRSTKLFYHGYEDQHIDTPDILSSTQLRSFYIKIEDGKLQFGKKGAPPLMSHSGFDLGLLNIYQFKTIGGPTKIRYCPADVEVDCGSPPLLLHGSAELLNGTTYLGDVAEYSCSTKYQLVGPTWRTCSEDFQWSETAPTCKLLPCKEQSVNWGGETPNYSMDNVSLNHYGTQTRNSTGHRTYFELHFALQTDGTVGIQLTDKEISSFRCTIYVGFDRNRSTKLYIHGYEYQHIDTPDILSSTQFRSFYIRIDDGKLQFGIEGDPPLMSHSDPDLGLLNIYQFNNIGGPTKIRYCPVADEESS